MVKPAKELYNEKYEYEWNRLVKSPYNKLEFETTLFFLKKYLPDKGLILDAGGGPGRYTIELAKRGYDLILLDPSMNNLQYAKKKIEEHGVKGNVIRIIEGSIINLSLFTTNKFDAVLCLGGPLGYLKSNERDIAVKELIRVAKSEAPIFVSVISKFGTLLNCPKWPDEVANDTNWKSLVEKGDDYRFQEDYYSHFFTSKELKTLFNKKDIDIIKLVGLEGLSNPLHTLVNKMEEENQKAWNNWLDAHYKFLEDPVVVDISAHFMLICKKI